MESINGLSRRDFLKGSALVSGAIAGGSLLAGCSSQSQKANDESVTWDKEVDVVVIGYGGAGAATAITAHDAGAEVLIMEKMAEPGGNTVVSLGGFLHVTDTDAAYEYTKALFDLSLAELDEDIVRVFVDECAKNVEWVSSLEEGIEPEKYGGASYSSVEGSETQEKFWIPRDGMRTGKSLFTAYQNAVENVRGIEVLLGTAATELVTDGNGAVIGVVAESDGKPFTVKARKGVALTCGGFEFDEESKQNYLKGTPVYASGSEGNTGDGVRMAQKVGAKLWHMTGASACLGWKVTDDMPTSLPTTTAGIVVDKNAKRFMNEPALEGHAGLVAVDFYDSHHMDFPRIPCYYIFDDDMCKTKRLMTGRSGAFGGQYTWSKDNSEEVAKGWVPFANTLEELAEKMGLDPSTLVETVYRYNEDVANGEDTEWGRTIEKDGEVVSAPIVTPPFYAIELYPTLLNTQGGPRRNAKAEVIDAFGNPIPRLYSAGELGSFWGIIYQGAGNNTESMVFGRIAGENLAALDPWDDTQA